MLQAPGRRIELSALEAQSDEETVPQTLPARKPLAPPSDATRGLIVTALWTPVPLWLSLDGGVRSLPAPARVALYELAVNGGGARCGDDPSEALDGLCAGAGASLGAMLARRVVAVEGGRLRLVAPDGAAPARAATEAPTHSGAEGEPAEDRASVKRLAALWSKGGVETHEARLSWIDSPAGVRFLAREGRDKAWALDRADRSHGVNSGRFGRRQPPTSTVSTPSTPDTADGVSHGVNSPLPPTPPLSENNEERSEIGARAHGVNPVNLGGVNSVNPTASTPSTPTPSAHGPATTPTSRSLLDAFREAAKNATLVGNMSEERGLADMLARLAPSSAEVVAMGAALGDAAAWWPPGKRAAPKHITLRDLAGWKGADGSPEWAPLSALVGHVRAKGAPSRAQRPADPEPVFVNLGRNCKPLHRGA